LERQLSAEALENINFPEQLNISRRNYADKSRSKNLSHLAHESDRQLFLPEEVNFPESAADTFGLQHRYYNVSPLQYPLPNSLLHQVLRSSVNKGLKKIEGTNKKHSLAEHDSRASQSTSLYPPNSQTALNFNGS